MRDTMAAAATALGPHVFGDSSRLGISITRPAFSKAARVGFRLLTMDDGSTPIRELGIRCPSGHSGEVASAGAEALKSDLWPEGRVSR